MNENVYTNSIDDIQCRMNQKSRYVFSSFVSLNSFNGIAFARIGTVPYSY